LNKPIGSGRVQAPEEPEQLSAIRRRLLEATAGEGRVAYLEGAPGSGKTELLVAASEAASAAGMRVLEARGQMLERDFAFGVAIQLFEEAWFAAPESERSSLLKGPARPAGEMISGARPVGSGFAGEHVYTVIRGLFWLTRAPAASGHHGAPGKPLALIVDDVDFADAPSLRFLAYLASRIRNLPIAVVVTARPVSTSEDAPALTALRSASEIHVLGPLEHPAAGPRRIAAQMALRESLAEGHRESVVDLAELAWSDGALLDSDEDKDAWPDLVGSLLFVDELERAAQIARGATRRGRAVAAPGAAQHWMGWSLYHQGQITTALAVAEAARAARGDDRTALGLLAACRLAQGRLDEAEVALPTLGTGEDVDELDAAVLLDLRAQLRLAQLRPTDALEDALEAGRRCRATWGSMGPGVVAWRSTAALARLDLGASERARALAQEELALARERGLRRVIIRDLRILAFAAKGTRTLDLLAEAVKVGRAADAPRLEYVNALVDLGAATRRANQRTAARHPLRMGLELAERGGAAALARRAREELEATGARSRRVMLSGINALTPSERRVANLAARGLTTRQIAQVLFVTPKTVEFHLRHVYRKLDIPSSRAELTSALSPADSG
jgi:DNA-binding CsgD family transcriptional regulator